MRMLSWEGRPERGEDWQVDSVLFDLGRDRLHATGVQLGLAPVAYRLEWALDTVPGFVTSRLTVWAQGAGWSRSLHLTRGEEGAWRAVGEHEGEVGLPEPGGEAAGLEDALDCDLGGCPLTNTMPVLRHGLHRPGGSPRTFTMAWVSVPDLTVHVSRQRYLPLPAVDDTALVRYRSGSFTADLTLDHEGLVLNYPGLARRVADGR